MAQTREQRFGGDYIEEFLEDQHEQAIQDEIDFEIAMFDWEWEIEQGSTVWEPEAMTPPAFF